jgi:hypothetical protein
MERKRENKGLGILFDLHLCELRFVVKELKTRKKQLPSQCFCKEKKNTKNTKSCSLGGG